MMAEEKRGRKLWLAIPVTVILGYWVFRSAGSDYRWAGEIARARFSEGWSVAAAGDNYAVIEKPWTIFKAPISALWFVRMGEMTNDGAFKIVPVLFVQHDGLRRTTEDHYLEPIS